MAYGRPNGTHRPQLRRDEVERTNRRSWHPAHRRSLSPRHPGTRLRSHRWRTRAAGSTRLRCRCVRLPRSPGTPSSGRARALQRPLGAKVGRGRIPAWLLRWRRAGDVLVRPPLRARGSPALSGGRHQVMTRPMRWYQATSSLLRLLPVQSPGKECLRRRSGSSLSTPCHGPHRCGISWEKGPRPIFHASRSTG